jgi:hypothetical protein
LIAVSSMLNHRLRPISITSALLSLFVLLALLLLLRQGRRPPRLIDIDEGGQDDDWSDQPTWLWASGATGMYLLTQANYHALEWRRPHDVKKAIDPGGHPDYPTFPESCTCDAERASKLPKLEETWSFGESFDIFGEPERNPYFKPPLLGNISHNMRIVMQCDLEEALTTVGFNGIMAYSELGFWEPASECAVLTCLGAYGMKGCNITQLAEVARPTVYRPTHAPWIQLSVVLKGLVKFWVMYRTPISAGWLDDTTEDPQRLWKEVMEKICSFHDRRMSASVIYTCALGAGSGYQLGRDLKWRNDGKSDQEIIYARDGFIEDSVQAISHFCSYAPTRAMGYECAVGGFQRAHSNLKATGPGPCLKMPCADSGTRSWAWPCVSEKFPDGVPFVVGCLESLFSIYNLHEWGLDHLEWKQRNPAYVSCFDKTDSLSKGRVFPPFGKPIMRTEHLRIACIYAQANHEFPRTDNFMWRGGYAVSGADEMNKLTFLQGSGLDNGTLMVGEGQTLCRDVPDECTLYGDGTEKAGAGLAAPTTLIDFCVHQVGDPKKNTTWMIYRDHKSTTWHDFSKRYLACVAGAMGHGEIEREFPPPSNSNNDHMYPSMNIANVVDAWDVPPYIVRRVCHQLRYTEAPLPPARVVGLGEEAALLCEKRALYFAVKSHGWFKKPEDYEGRPMELLDVGLPVLNGISRVEQKEVEEKLQRMKADDLSAMTEEQKMALLMG